MYIASRVYKGPSKRPLQMAWWSLGHGSLRAAVQEERPSAQEPSWILLVHCSQVTWLSGSANVGPNKDMEDRRQHSLGAVTTETTSICTITIIWPVKKLSLRKNHMTSLEEQKRKFLPAPLTPEVSFWWLLCGGYHSCSCLKSSSALSSDLSF